MDSYNWFSLKGCCNQIAFFSVLSGGCCSVFRPTKMCKVFELLLNTHQSEREGERERDSQIPHRYMLSGAVKYVSIGTGSAAHVFPVRDITRLPVKKIILPLVY